MNARVERLADAGKEALSSLGYLWHETAETVKTYPDIPLAYLLIEGDTCIGAVCREVESEAGSALDRNHQEMNE